MNLTLLAAAFSLIFWMGVLVHGSTDGENGDQYFPYFVTILQLNETGDDYVDICMGTIVGEKLVLTAADCFS